MKKSIPFAIAAMLWLAGNVATQSPLPPTVQFSVNNYYTSENAGTATITVTLIGYAGGNTVTVDYATADGSATSGADYVATSGTLTFAPGETSKTFTVDVKTDLIAEGDETVLLSLKNPANAVLGIPSSATLTIWDSPPPKVQFDLTNYYVSENTGTVTITASLMGDTGGNTVTVNYATADGSATAPADYASTSGTLTFSPGTWSQSFTVTVNRDLVAESDETVLLSLSSPTNAVLGTNSSATLTIWDSPPPTVQFDMTSYSVSENTGTVTITASLMGDTGGNTVTVNYATADGSATAPADYASTSGTLTFSPGTWSQSFTVTVNRDLVAESDETVLLSLSSPTNAVLGTNSSATLTIWDSPPPTVQFDMTSYSVSENTGTVTITASLMGDTGGNTVTVNYATADGSATAPADYASTSGTLTFSPGTWSQSFTVTVNRDLVAESDETVLLSLSSPTNAVLGTNSSATLTIWDSPPPTVQFDFADYTTSETSGAVTITASLTGDVGGNTVTVDYVTADGTATAGSDYQAASGTLTFPPGTTSQSFTVTIYTDAVTEPSETVLLSLSNATNAVLGSNGSATLTITDCPPPTVQFSASSYTVSESAGMANITVTLSTASASTVTVDYSTADGTAVAGIDYEAASGTLTFTPGTTTQSFSVTIKDLGANGPNKTATLSLTSPTNAVLGSPSTADLIIMDDDAPVDVSVSIDVDGFSPSPAAAGDMVDATLTAKAVRPSSSSSLSSPAWTWTYIKTESSQESLSGPWSPASTPGYSIFSAPCPPPDSVYDYDAVTISTSWTEGAYYQMTWEAQVDYTNAAFCCFRGRRQCVPQVIIVSVDKIIVQGVFPFNTGPVSVAVGESIGLQVLPRPANVAFWPPGWPVWTITAQPSNIGNPPGATDLATITPDKPGTYTIQAACGVSTCSFDVKGVGVEKIIIKDSSPENVGPKVVVAGKQIKLKAKPDPAGADWPAGKPVWTIETKPDMSGVANPAAGSDEATITPDKPGKYIVKAACGTSSKTFEINAIKVTLELKADGTIVEAPENEDYEAEKASAGGTDKLGPLPIGEGRGDEGNKGKCYIAPIMVIGKVEPDSAATMEFRWKRLISRRAWNIVKTGGTKWVVTKYNQRGTPTAEDDTGDDAFNDPTPSDDNKKIYIYDCAGMNLDPLTQAKGDYIHQKADFTYRVDVKIDGVWVEAASIHVGQKIIAKRKDTTGTVPKDWDGIENSNAVRTLAVTVTEADIRAIVGGDLPIEIDANANED